MLGLEFSVMAPPACAEPLPTSGEVPIQFALRSALAKAQSLAGAELAPSSPLSMPVRESLIIAADTVVALDGRIYGKPANHEEAFHFLSQLAGKTHEVTTGVALSLHGQVTAFVVTSQVTFWECPPSLLRAYAEDQEVLDKAGAYAIQEKGAFLVQSINGSWTNVVGLPVAELVQVLLDKGYARTIHTAE